MSDSTPISPPEPDEVIADDSYEDLGDSTSGYIKTDGQEEDQ